MFFFVFVYSVIPTDFVIVFDFHFTGVFFHVLCTIHVASQHHTSVTSQLKSNSCEKKKEKKIKSNWLRNNSSRSLYSETPIVEPLNSKII